MENAICHWFDENITLASMNKGGGPNDAERTNLYSGLAEMSENGLEWPSDLQ